MFPTLPGIEDYSSWIVARFCIIKLFNIITLIINVIIIVIVIVIVIACVPIVWVIVIRSNVKWLEAGGVQVVPIIVNGSLDQTDYFREVES